MYICNKSGIIEVRQLDQIDSVIFYKPISDIYGVKINRSLPFKESIERTGAAENLISNTEIEGEAVNQDDFMENVYPYNCIKRCNILANKNIVYDGQSGFSVENNTFIEIPLFYMRRYIKGDYEYRDICREQKEGFYPAPMFVEGEKVLDKVYIACYETSINSSNIAQSVSGVNPLSGISLSQYRDLYNKKGYGYSGVDIRTIMSIQHLYLIRFANKNSQVNIGTGWTFLSCPTQPILNQNDGVTDSVVIADIDARFSNSWFVGMNIGFLAKGYLTVKQLSSYKRNYPSKNQVTLYFNEKIDLKSFETCGGCFQKTGYSDRLISDTGHSKYTSEDGKKNCSVRLFWLENFWGNVWELTEGLWFKSRIPYISFDCTNYNDQATGYIPLSTQIPLQVDNTNQTNGVIRNLGLDDQYTWFGMPDSLGGNTFPSPGYGDFFYSNENQAYCIFGGGFDHVERAGLFVFRNWGNERTSWYLYGSRMQFKNIE